MVVGNDSLHWNIGSELCLRFSEFWWAKCHVKFHFMFFVFRFSFFDTFSFIFICFVCPRKEPKNFDTESITDVYIVIVYCTTTEHRSFGDIYNIHIVLNHCWHIWRAEIIYEHGNESKASGKQNERYHSRRLPHIKMLHFSITIRIDWQ